MLTFIKRVLGGSSASTATVLGEPDEIAPDGNHDRLRSGIWALQPAIPVEAFPETLLLTEKDGHLTPAGADLIVLSAVKAGKHEIELLLADTDKDTVALVCRIPTAANQFKEPYVILEAERGNTREEAVREIDFHLRGRVDEDNVRRVDWFKVFAAAAAKLEALRGH